MTISLDDFVSLQRKVQQLRQERDRAEGALEQLIKQLRKDHDCKSLDEAQELLTKMKKEELKVYKEYVAAKEAFEEKYREVLESDDE